MKCIDSRGFWPKPEESPSKQGYHYYWNAGTYMDVGVSLGGAMAELLQLASAKSDDEGGPWAIPADARAVLEKAESFELFSLDPNFENETTKDSFHGVNVYAGEKISGRFMIAGSSAEACIKVLKDAGVTLWEQPRWRD